jgi:hypothetical protein
VSRNDSTGDRVAAVRSNDSNEDLTSRYQVLDKHSPPKMLYPGMTAATKSKKHQESALSKYTQLFVTILLFPFLLVFLVHTVRLFWNITRDVLQELLFMSKILLLEFDLSLSRKSACLIVAVLVTLSPLYFFFAWVWVW